MSRVIFFAIFAGIFAGRLYQTRPAEIAAGQAVKITGHISQLPYLKGSDQIISVGQYRARISSKPPFFYGQKIQLIGTASPQVPGQFLTRYWLYQPEIQLVSATGWRQNFWRIRGSLVAFRKQLAGIFAQVLPSPHAELLAGMVLGQKSNLPERFYEALRKTGTLHVVVASGQNIAIVTGFLLALLPWLVSRRKAVFFALLGAVCYILLTGAEPPVVRAGIMAGLSFLAESGGREGAGKRLLLFSAAVMLLVSPWLVFELSFQLSFAATAGLLWLYPKLRRWRPFRVPLVGDGLATSLSAQLAVAPLLFWQFGRLSLVSPAVNALVGVTVPFLMALGLVIIALGLVWLPSAQLVAWLAWPLLEWFIKIVEIFGGRM